MRREHCESCDGDRHHQQIDILCGKLRKVEPEDAKMQYHLPGFGVSGRSESAASRTARPGNGSEVARSRSSRRRCANGLLALRSPARCSDAV